MQWGWVFLSLCCNAAGCEVTLCGSKWLCYGRDDVVIRPSFFSAGHEVLPAK